MIADTMHSAALVLLGLLLAVFAFVAVSRWRLGLYCFLVWLVFEDLPRKFLGNDMVVYFGKDVLVAAVYLGYFLDARRSNRPRLRASFIAPLLCFAALCAAQVFNPSSPSPLYGLLGLKLYLYYAPLVILGSVLIQTDRDLRTFLVFNLALAGIVAALGVAQGIVGLDFLNPAITPEHLHLLRIVRETPLGGELVPRPTSVFVSDGRFAWYMLLTLFLGLAAATYEPLRRDRRRWIVTVSLVLTVAAILLSGSRGTFVYAVASLLVYGAAVLWGMTRALGSRKVLGSLARIAAVTGAAVITAAGLFPDAVGARWAFYYETIAPWSPASELAYRVREYPAAEFLKAFSYPNWLLGYGLGTASLGVQYLTSVFSLPTIGATVESGYGALVLEMGVPGLIAWLAWTVTLVAAAWGVTRRLRHTPLFPVAFSIVWFAVLLLFPLTYGGLPPYQNFVFNAYLWLLIGVLFALPRLRANQEVASTVVSAREPS